MSLSNGCHQDIGAAAFLRQIDRFGVADSHGGIRVEQQQSHRLAHDIAAADDHGVTSGDWNIVAAQHFQDAHRRAGARSRDVFDERADVQGMETVDIFVRLEGTQDTVFIHLRRQRGLDQDAIDLQALV